MNGKLLFSLAGSILLAGCATQTLPGSIAEGLSGYTYIPLDPFAVKTVLGDSCKEGETDNGSLLNSFPDNAVRMLIEQVDAGTTLAYGPVKTSARGAKYRVTVDYINADTVNERFFIGAYTVDAMGNKQEVNLAMPKIDRDKIIYTVERAKDRDGDYRGPGLFNIPIYIGVGLRITANITDLSGNSNVSGIGVLGVEADAKNIRGDLVVQTLGINGKSISAALPIQNELNRTTAQNAIVSVASIKALLHSDETIVWPRVVGLYLPLPGDKALVNALISELSKQRVEWPRPCAPRNAKLIPAPSASAPRS